MSNDGLSDLLTRRFILLVLVIVIVGALAFAELLPAQRAVDVIIGVLVGAGVLEGGFRMDSRSS